jgi:ribosomal protein L40E
MVQPELFHDFIGSEDDDREPQCVPDSLYLEMCGENGALTNSGRAKIFQAPDSQRLLGNLRGLEFFLSHVVKYVGDQIGYGVFEILAALVDLICVDCRARPLGALTVCRHCQSTRHRFVETLCLLWIEVKAYEYLLRQGIRDIEFLADPCAPITHLFAEAYFRFGSWPCNNAL